MGTRTASIREENGMTAAIDIVKASFDRWDAIDQVYSSFRVVGG
jgi:hypothetical protein